MGHGLPGPLKSLSPRVPRSHQKKAQPFSEVEVEGIRSMTLHDSEGGPSQGAREGPGRVSDHQDSTTTGGTSSPSGSRATWSMELGEGRGLRGQSWSWMSTHAHVVHACQCNLMVCHVRFGQYVYLCDVMRCDGRNAVYVRAYEYSYIYMHTYEFELNQGSFIPYHDYPTF